MSNQSVRINNGTIWGDLFQAQPFAVPTFVNRVPRQQARSFSNAIAAQTRNVPRTVRRK